MSEKEKKDVNAVSGGNCCDIDDVIYTFQCTKCGKKLEVKTYQYRNKVNVPDTCESCGGKLEILKKELCCPDGFVDKWNREWNG